MGGVASLQIDFDVKFDSFMNTFRDEARMVHDTSQMILHGVISSMEKLKMTFCLSLIHCSKHLNTSKLRRKQGEQIKQCCESYNYEGKVLKEYTRILTDKGKCLE
jgi:hypothetical protein